MRHITGKTKMFALLGYPVSHSISPFIHNEMFQAKDYDGQYMLLKAAPDNLAAAVTVLRENFSGFNVTIPHKQTVMEYLDEVDPLALLYGAVNTVKNDNGRLIGYNTDGAGFIKAFAVRNLPIEGRQVLLLGAGGSARAVLGELLRKRCRVVIANRTAAKAEELAVQFSEVLPGEAVAATPGCYAGEFDYVVNTTSVGMGISNAEMPLPASVLAGVKGVYDLIYNPAETRLLACARNHGCSVVNGLPMLYYQAEAANDLWTGKVVSPAVSEELFHRTEAHLREIGNK